MSQIEVSESESRLKETTEIQEMRPESGSGLHELKDIVSAVKNEVPLEAIEKSIKVATINDGFEGKVQAIDVASFVPVNNGNWEAGKGDSDWTPEDEYIPLKHNPEQKTWAQIKEEYKFESIPFNEGEPDFTEVSKATVEIEDFSTDRHSNFTQADEQCAEQWTQENKDGKSWTHSDISAYRQEHKLTWHERSDQRTMDLVPLIVHGNVTHTGGISAAKVGENNGRKSN